MSRNRLLVGVAAAAVAVSGLAATALPATAAQHDDTTTIATTVTANGWVPNAQGPGSGSITGAAAPDGETAAKLTTQGDGTIETLFGTSYVGTKFADVTGLSYDTYVENSNSSLLAPSIGFEVWGGDSDTFLGSMVYEPYVADAGQPVQTGTWQRWNAMDPNALWWSTRATLNPDGTVLYPAQEAHTLAQFEAAFAAYPAKYGNLHTENGVKTYVGESVASPDWNDFVAYVDNVHVTTQGDNSADTDWDFTTGIGPCSATEDDASQTYTLTQDCTTYDTINVPDGWTIDGAGHTLTAVEDASHQNFPGPVLLSAEGTDSGAATMNVENLDIESSGFENGQNSGGQLAGIKYDRAGGSISNVTINGISHGNGVQEGIGLWVRNRDASGSYLVPGATVSVDHLTVTNYQKGGVIFDGNLHFTMTNSTIGAAGGPDGTPLTSIAANSVQISRDAFGTISGNTIALNEYNPVPPPGDGSDATAILVYDARTVSISDNLITGGNGDVGLDTYNDSQGALSTVVNVSCNLFSRNESQGDYDPYGVGIAQYDDDSTPVEVDLSDTTFSGWKYNTSTISYDQSGAPIFGAGATDQQLGQCPPSAPTNVSVSGGDGQTGVSWSASTAPAYAPLSGYTVTATDAQGQPVATKQVGPDTNSTVLTGLTNGQDYTISVVANSAGGSSAPGTAVLHSTSIALVANDSTIPFGGKTTINGRLTSTDPNAQLDGRMVDIQSRPAGDEGDWITIATKAAASDGLFSIVVHPLGNRDYRAVYGGDPDLGSVSPTTTVDVSMAVKTRVSKKKGHVGTKFKFTGVVNPNHAGQPVELQVKQGSTWVEVDSTTLDGASAFALVWKANAVGVFSFRVFASGDETHVDGTSKVFKVTVH
jgi:hypothetical protein